MEIQIIEKNNIPVVSHLEVAEKTNNDKDSVARLIKNYTEELENFWVIGFEIQKPIWEFWWRPTKEYFLNEDQATFLMTLLKNTKEVVDFKLKLVLAFKKLKEHINKPKTFEEIMKDALLLADRKVKELEEEKKFLEKRIEKDKPKVEFAEVIWNAEDSILLRDFCKVLNGKWINIWQNKLYAFLRKEWILMKNNRPYQTYSKYFPVKENIVKTLAKDIITFTTCINWKGQAFVFKRLKESY